MTNNLTKDLYRGKSLIFQSHKSYANPVASNTQKLT